MSHTSASERSTALFHGRAPLASNSSSPSGGSPNADASNGGGGGGRSRCGKKLATNNGPDGRASPSGNVGGAPHPLAPCLAPARHTLA